MLQVIYRKYVASALVLGFVLEALAPNKVSTVSYWKPVKDLTIDKFIATAPILYKIYESVLNEKAPTPRVSYWIRVTAAELINDEFVRTNTCLGYVILTVPIIYAVKFYDEPIHPTWIARQATNLLHITASKESAEEFYEALRALNPSYTNKYVGKVPDIHSKLSSSFSLLDVLIESSYYDLIAYEVTHQYELTIHTYKYMVELLREQPNILDCISRTQHYMLSKYMDSEVVKGFGVEKSLLIRSYLQVVNLLKDREISKNELIETLDNHLRHSNVNPGTISDILALATAFTLLERDKPNAAP